MRRATNFEDFHGGKLLSSSATKSGPLRNLAGFWASARLSQHAGAGLRGEPHQTEGTKGVLSQRSTKAVLGPPGGGCGSTACQAHGSSRGWSTATPDSSG